MSERSVADVGDDDGLNVLELVGVTKEYARHRRCAALDGVDLAVPTASWSSSSGRPGPASRR